jgi:hypothetical protein
LDAMSDRAGPRCGACDLEGALLEECLPRAEYWDVPLEGPDRSADSCAGYWILGVRHALIDVVPALVRTLTCHACHRRAKELHATVMVNGPAGHSAGGAVRASESPKENEESLRENKK